jgi:hypothetical protein
VHRERRGRKGGSPPALQEGVQGGARAGTALEQRACECSNRENEEEEERGRQRMDKAGEEASEWCGSSDVSGHMSSSISVFYWCRRKSCGLEEYHYTIHLFRDEPL